MNFDAFFLQKDLLFAHLCDRTFGGMPVGQAASEGTAFFLFYSKLSKSCAKSCFLHAPT